MHVDFSISLGTVATVLSILVSTWALLRGIRRLQEAVTVGIWEHRVMWGWFEREHAERIPEYPNTEKR